MTLMWSMRQGDGHVDLSEWMAGYGEFRKLIHGGAAAATPAPAPSPAQPAMMGSPTRELVLAGAFSWRGAAANQQEPASKWELRVMADAAGVVFGSNRRQTGWEMHYRGRKLGNNRLEARALFDCGAIFAYAIEFFGGNLFAGPS